MPFDGAKILIVDSEIGTFIISLRQALEAVGAESVVARDTAEVEQRCHQFQFSAVLLNEEHEQIEDELSAKGLPVHVYSKVSTPRAIITALQLRLEN